MAMQFNLQLLLKGSKKEKKSKSPLVTLEKKERTRPWHYSVFRKNVSVAMVDFRGVDQYQ